MVGLRGMRSRTPSFWSELCGLQWMPLFISGSGILSWKMSYLGILSNLNILGSRQWLTYNDLIVYLVQVTYGNLPHHRYVLPLQIEVTI